MRKFKRNYILIFILILMTFLGACIQQSPNTSRKITVQPSIEDDGSDGSGDANDPTFSTSDDIYWYSNKKIEGAITINQDTKSVIYLRGSKVHSYLGSDSLNNLVYCLVINFQSANLVDQLRLRAIPISFNNLLTNSVEQLLRIDVPYTTDNQTACSGTVDTAGATVAYSPVNLCTTCSNIYTATSVRLYTSTNNTISDLSIVPQADLDVSSLSLRVDASSSQLSTTGNCTNGICQAQGYDCCLDGQCVKDGSMRPNASTHSDYQQAISEVSQDSSNFRNWPSIYFICSNTVYATPTPTTTPDAQATADAFLEQAKKDYYCLEGAKETVPDYTQCTPNGDYDSYILVRNDVWDRCGCEADPNADPPQGAEDLCPDFGLKTITDVNSNILEVVCDIPDPGLEPTPFQNLEVNVSTHSAPHRFFRADNGNWVDDIAALPETDKNAELNGTPVSEGTAFYYSNDSGKTEPENGQFNMNSILGQMSLELNETLPATVVDIEHDQTYILHTISGYYTPCPQCARDSWFDTFTSMPPSQLGVGLRANGYSSTRDAYNDNTTYGNYEDTIFGRACWIPPTMIPWSHKRHTNVQTQRLNRLATQAAYYVNGYQRDWFGFNKGAVIGSFDGVRWFAIGSGRRVISTSNKLFLAINDSFLDLSEKNTMIVSITSDLGNNIAASYDFNDQIDMTDSRVNQAGTCQYWHQCTKDSDCIAQLGWEYVCANITKYRTNWPNFNSDAEEIANNQIDRASFYTILQSGLPTGTATKRCVYRGAGALCKRDYSTITDDEHRKLLTCAPNFYCADLDNSVFNDQIVRTPNAIEMFMFGQESDFLGRPLNYVKAQESLSEDIKDNIKDNAAIFASNETNDFGLCRPGKSVTYTTHLDQHKYADIRYRTDFISQVGGCNSSSTTVLGRVHSCPVFEEDTENEEYGNYVLSPTDTDDYHRQNMCGTESQYVEDVGLYTSTFKDIEAEPIPSLNSLITPMLAQDACLRRAGTFCHTDLDCGPNKLHSQQAEYYGNAYFGGTAAEAQYWREYLVCSQGDEAPIITSGYVWDYDIKKNRCCRAAGQDFTMYTQGNDTLIPDYNLAGDNTNLLVNQLPYEGPSIDGRYSRYSVVAPLVDSASGSSGPYFATPKVETGTTPTPYQWKTLQETGKKNCCGTGWVRKFASGSNNWETSYRNLSIDVSNYACLNYRSSFPFIHENPDDIFTVTANLNKGQDKLCLKPTELGCIQYPIYSVENFELVYPIDLVDTDFFIDTTPLDPLTSGGGTIKHGYGRNAPYQPVAYSYYFDQWWQDEKGPYTIFLGIDYDTVSFYLPSYISASVDKDGSNLHIENIVSVYIRYYDDDGLIGESEAVHNCDSTGLGCNNTAGGVINSTTGDPWVNLCPGTYCLARDHVSTGGEHVLMHVRANYDAWAYTYAGVEITFVPVNYPGHYFNNNGTAQLDSSRDALESGNALYYLTKLGRLELLGIPQIFYEPIYCSSDKSQMVDGIFNTSSPTRSDFEDASFSFQYNGQAFPGSDKRYNLWDIYYPNEEPQSNDGSNSNGNIVFQDKVQLGQIFSGHEFKCCIKLGNPTSSASKCCSNYSVPVAEEESTVEYCRLPPRTNLNVYFNRFVSSEGVGADEPGGGFTDDDFVPETGELKLRNSTYNKLTAMGASYCYAGQIRKGGAFGKFYGEPNSGYFTQEGDPEDGRIFSIVDSNFDSDDDENGTLYYIHGFRWNHHYYCQ